MRHLFLAVMLIAPLPSPARAMSVHQAASEARGFLRPCVYKNVYRQGLCQQNQVNFVEEYVRALAGDRSAQGSTMASFSRLSRDPTFDLGEPSNQVFACAWATVIYTETPRGDPNRPVAAAVVGDQCKPLDPHALAVAALAAAKLQARLRSDSVHLPPRWDPTSRDLFPTGSRLTPHAVPGTRR